MVNHLPAERLTDDEWDSIKSAFKGITAEKINDPEHSYSDIKFLRELARYSDDRGWMLDPARPGYVDPARCLDDLNRAYFHWQQHGSLPCLTFNEIEKRLKTAREETIDAYRSYFDPDEDTSPKAPDMLTGEDVALMHRGKAHLLYAVRDTGKTTLATIAAAQELLAGNAVAWWDYEAQFDQVTERLMILGVPADVIDERFLHFGAPGLDATRDILESLSVGIGQVPSLFVADAARGLAEALAPGVHDTMGHDVAAVEREFVNPIRSRGSSVFLLTHEAAGTAFGSQHWESMADVVMRMTPGQHFDRENDGYSDVHVVRDRTGYLVPGNVARMKVVESVPELVKPEGQTSREGLATGKGTGKCSGPRCGRSIDKRAEMCKGCSAKSRARDNSGKLA